MSQTTKAITIRRAVHAAAAVAKKRRRVAVGVNWISDSDGMMKVSFQAVGNSPLS
jgi:hypothetical protein